LERSLVEDDEWATEAAAEERGGNELLLRKAELG
jgi:hypothetical protein